jgi:hypothetical protein
MGKFHRRPEKPALTKGGQKADIRVGEEKAKWQLP